MVAISLKGSEQSMTVLPVGVVGDRVQSNFECQNIICMFSNSVKIVKLPPHYINIPFSAQQTWEIISSVLTLQMIKLKLSNDQSQ